MANEMFKKDWFKVSDLPADFIPSGAEVFLCIDYADGVDRAVKGFYDRASGEWHIQEITETRPKTSA